MAQAMDFGGVRRAVEVLKEQGYGAGFGVVDGAEQASGQWSRRLGPASAEKSK